MNMNNKNIQMLTQKQVFYKGVVVDNKDPLESLRVKVRVIGIDDPEIEVEKLPWCIRLSESLFAGMNATTFLKQGTFVLVTFFQDDPNQRIILGSLLGVNTYNNEIKGFSDPNNEYPGEYKDKADTNNKSLGEKYLKNQVFETKAGHYIEIDDSEEDLRIHIFHSTGTYVLIDNDGNININGIKDRFKHIEENNTEEIGKDESISIKGNREKTVEGDEINSINGNLKITVKGNVEMEVGGDCSAKVSGNTIIESSGNCNVTASMINLN